MADVLKWEWPELVMGFAVLANANSEQVIAKVRRDDSTRLWRGEVVGALYQSPEFTSSLGAQMWVQGKLHGMYNIEEVTK